MSNVAMCLNNESANYLDGPVATVEATSTSTRMMISRQMLRSSILNVGLATGSLCGVVDKSPHNMAELTSGIARAFRAVASVSDAAHIDIVRAIRGKLALNAKKYPVELCKGKAGKYTKYSDVTGVTKDNQSLLGCSSEHVGSEGTSICPPPFPQLQSLLLGNNLLSLAASIQEFAVARDWAQFHTPRNIVLAMLGEVGELSELVQWMGDDDKAENSQDAFTPEFLDKLGQEIADVSIYLLRICTVCGVTEAVLDHLTSHGQ